MADPAFPPPSGPHPAALRPSLDELLKLLRDRFVPTAGLIDREMFAALLGVGVSAFDRLRSAGAIGPRPVRLRGSATVRFSRAEAEAWIAHPGPGGELHDAATWPAVWEALSRKR